MALAPESQPAAAQRRAKGCWTCKCRRKKCDDAFPICDACGTLQLTCYHSVEKPEWMDGGPKQEQMAEWLKHKVKETAHRRRLGRSANASNDSTSGGGWDMLPPQRLSEPVADDNVSFSSQTLEAADSSLGCNADQKRDAGLARRNRALHRSDIILVNFYLESVFPFLFPFHQPSGLQGGRAWLLELMLHSPFVRKATLCQSSYYLSLLQGTANYDDSAWEAILEQTKDAFEVLRQALSIITGEGLATHVHGATRILAGIMQLQRFEAAIMSFENCQSHLNAAVALFQQLLESENQDAPDVTCARSCFDSLIDRLGPSSSTPSEQPIHIPSAEQAAFRFSSGLLIFDDIIASTVLQEPPKLRQQHDSLLRNSFDSTGPAIDLKDVAGCDNWPIIQIAEIATLDAWKQECRRAGNLDMMQLVHRATPIRQSLEVQLAFLEAQSANASPSGQMDTLDVFKAHYQHTGPNQSMVVTQVWAHAAIIYLLVVVSGFQQASDDIKHHVRRVTGLLTQLSPSSLLRVTVWPFCVAGCLATPDEETEFRALTQISKPPGIFGTIHKALTIMENVWRNRDSITTDWDLAACFRAIGETVLLV